LDKLDGHIEEKKRKWVLESSTEDSGSGFVPRETRSHPVGGLLQPIGEQVANFSDPREVSQPIGDIRDVLWTPAKVDSLQAILSTEKGSPLVKSKGGEASEGEQEQGTLGTSSPLSKGTRTS
jgi:hypothetical protein